MKQRAPRGKKPIAPPAPGAPGGEVVVYTAPDGAVAVDVTLQAETVWLSLNQISRLFGRDKSVVSRHLRNIFQSKELGRRSVVAFFATTAADGKTYSVEYFNLDAILSVGYRVNSKRGTQFRIWATRVLREHVVRGYSVNQRRLAELNQAVRLVADVAQRRALTGDEATGLLRVVADYSRALALLDAYDHQRPIPLTAAAGTARPVTVDDARQVVARLRREYGGSDLFGREKDQSLAGALGAVFQTFDGRDLYLSLEEKATQLLYLLVKNHPFVDGNKRIAAALFLWFLDHNNALYFDGHKRIDESALVAITLLIAESKAGEKDQITRLVVSLLLPGSA